MKFEFWTTPGYSHIKAVFEKGDSRTGKREEGIGTQITLVDDTVTFDYEVKNIHPDVLGLLCLINFFPFVGNEVEFPKPVSFRLYEAFQNKCFRDKKNISFKNISNNVELYSGDNVAISFGGGIDSSSVREMFPEAFVVHEAHILNNKLISSRSHSIVEKLPSCQSRLVKTNIRYMSQPGGWHSWPCAVSSSLIMATDYNIGLILTGSNLGSSFLLNGVKFWDRLKARAWHGPSGNYWQSAFEAIGLTMFSPVSGVSEMQTMNQSLRLLQKNDVVYCMEKNGSECLMCPKCFRREIIRTFVESEYSPNWTRYNTDIIHSFLSKRPLYFGHIFSSAFSLKPEVFPDWIIQKVGDIPKVKTDWTMRVYSDSFLLCHEKWREYVSSRVFKFIEPMTKSDKQELRGWNQSSKIK